MVVAIAQHNLAKPCTDLGRAMMPPTLKLGLDGFESRGHPPLRSNPPDDESSVAVALPTVVSETKNVKVSGFLLTFFTSNSESSSTFFCSSNVRARRIVGGNHGLKTGHSSRADGSLRIHLPGATRIGTRKLLARR
jgi:hypothetical protein